MTAKPIPRGTSEIARLDHNVELIPLELIDETTNVRAELGDLEGLRASIEALGVLQPIRVHRDGDRFVVDVGHRRLAAARLAGEHFIRAVVDGERPASGRATVQLAENLARADLNALEEARAYRAILDAEPGLTQKALGERVGRAQSSIANSLALLSTAPEVQEAVAGGKLSGAHAKAIVGLEHRDQAEMLKRCLASGWSAHDLEKQVGWYAKGAKERAERRERSAAAVPALLKAIEKSVAKSTPIYVESDVLAAAIAAAGYPVVREWSYSQVSRVERAGECGCKAWIVEHYEYSISAPKLVPACIDPQHAEERRRAEHQRWADQRAQEEAARAAARAREDEAQGGRQARLRVALSGTPPIVLRLIATMAIEADGLYGQELWERLLPPGAEPDMFDEPWALIATLDDGQALDEAALAIASFARANDWRPEDGSAVREAIDGWLADVTPAADAAAPAPRKRKPTRSINLEDRAIVDDREYTVISVAYPGRHRPSVVHLRAVDDKSERKVLAAALSWRPDAKAWAAA